MRPQLLEPRGGYTFEVIQDTLGFVMEKVPPIEEIKCWSPLEKGIAYDWAIREHLHASGSLVSRRPQPYFLKPQVIVRYPDGDMKVFKEK